MASAAPRLLFDARPRLAVEGAPAPRLEEDLLRLETNADEDGMARLEAVFLNWGRSRRGRAPDFVWFDGEILDLGRAISVRAGPPEDEHEIFDGVITAIEGIFPELRPPEIKVCAEDRLQWLRMRQRSRFFEERSDADMASAIAGDYGLSPDVGGGGPTHAEFLQVNQSDLGYLRERARAVDARLALEDNRLRFRPRREPDGPPIQLTRENQLLRFEVAADLAQQRTSVRVHGYSIADKEAIHETADAAAVEAETEAGGRTGPAVLREVRPEAIEDMHLEAPATRDEARRLAEALMRRRARRFVSGYGITSGTPALRVGSKVDLVDLGPWFSGVYHVAEVRHSFDQRDGLRTRFLAERVELGASR